MERRDDVGNKVAVTVLAGLLVFCFTSFVTAAWWTANEGKNKAFEVSERMTSMEARFSSFQGDLQEIKDLLRRRIPNNFAGDK